MNFCEKVGEVGEFVQFGFGPSPSSQWKLGGFWRDKSLYSWDCVLLYIVNIAHLLNV